MSKESRIPSAFYSRQPPLVARELIGMVLGRRFEDGRVERFLITETEAYGGEEDQASHARFGKTKRNMVMYGRAGKVYMYLIYGMYWMLNVVSGGEGEAGAVLIRGVVRQDSGILINGPGKVGKALALNQEFYGEDLLTSRRLWIEEGTGMVERQIVTTPRIGVDYAGEWAKKPWRFVLETD